MLRTTLAAMSLLTLATTTPATAACRGESLFECRIGSKDLALCRSGNTVSYSFGPAGKPEMQITTQLEDLEYQPWQGFGRAIHESVTFRNEGIGYEVWTSFDRLGEAAIFEGGVNVISGGKTIATLNCRQGSVDAALDLLSAAKEGTGQCWNFEQQSWVTAPCP